MKMTTLAPISAAIARGDFYAAHVAIQDALIGETGPDWIKYLGRLAETLQDGRPRFAVIGRDGNGKLPFLTFSTLPGAGFCPGAGDCLSFCYSFRAHRYPAAYCRQAQNSILMQSAQGRAAILADLDACRSRSVDPVDFRLYVDGDFGSVAHIDFWMAALDARPWLAAYGYSKSFNEFLAYAAAGGTFPANYLLNLSGGHRHDAATETAMAALPCTRGAFKAVNVGHKVRTSDHAARAHQADLRQAYGSKAFTCPGKCGSCTPTGHACGSERFRGVDIIIAVH